MSDIIQGIRQKLIGVSAVTNLVGTRIRPGALAQGETLPAVTIDLDSGDQFRHLAGQIDMATSRVTLSVYAATRAAAVAAAEQIRLALHAFRGTAGSETIRSATLENRYDLEDLPTDGTASWRYLIGLSFLVTHAETTS